VEIGSLRSISLDVEVTKNYEEKHLQGRMRVAHQAPPSNCQVDLRGDIQLQNGF